MSEPRTACYVYCVVPAGERLSFAGVPGVHAQSGVELLTHGELAAPVSDVPLQEFGVHALERNLEDLEWLERTARAHDAVLARALESEAVVPLRLCTIFVDRARVGDMLDRERDRVLASLERVRGRAEWSVKLLADGEMLGAAVGAGSAADLAAIGEPETPGRAYFTRKQRERGRREQARAIAEAAALDTHAQLGQHAAAAAVLPPQNPELSRRSGEMVLNGTYLVDRSGAADFAHIARELGDRYRGAGLDLELSGPFAPYNFVTPTGRRR